MKTGLVLEGGAMRGMFTAGVLDAMMNNNITVMEQLVFQPEQLLVAISNLNKLVVQ